MSFLIKSKHFRILSCLLLLSAFLLNANFIQTTNAQDKSEAPPTPTIVKGKLPVIVIPGLLGSELINKNNEDTVWFNLQRSKTDDLRLPISTNIAANHDSLVPGDILRTVKLLKFFPETEIYERLTDALENTGGYTEGKWDAPTETGYEDTYYVFPYDWRRDNVENARLLIRRINELKLKLKKPNLKFNIIAHSMGGLIARYAARFGDADLPGGTRPIKPTWAGAKDINKIFMVGTPNQGAISALDSLINGLELLNAKGINLPFVQELSKYDVFTIPSAYQLLPHTGTARVFDENLKPLKIDLYNPLTWEKYGWTAYSDPDFAKQFSAEEQKQAKAYFRVVLSRAKRLEQALDSNISRKSPVSLYLLGGDCKPTLDAIIIYRNAKKNRWETIFHPKSFERSDGTKVESKDLETLFYAPGDGVVTQRSFLSSPIAAKLDIKKSALPSAFLAKDISFVCEVHNKLTGNPKIQSDLLGILGGK